MRMIKRGKLIRAHTPLQDNALWNKGKLIDGSWEIWEIDKHLEWGIPYNIMFWNTKGMSHLGARQKIVHMMTKNKFDILIILESHINANAKEMHDGYTVVFSTCISEEDIKRKEAAAAEYKAELKINRPRTREERYESQKRWAQITSIASEKLGMAVVYPKHMAKFALDV